jgi:hypothetical protein
MTPSASSPGPAAPAGAFRGVALGGSFPYGTAVDEARAAGGDRAAVARPWEVAWYERQDPKSGCWGDEAPRVRER